MAPNTNSKPLISSGKADEAPERPKTGGTFKREAGGSLSRTNKPQEFPAGGGPRNAKGVPIDSQHRELDADGRPKKKAAAASSSDSSKKGGK